MRQEVVSGSFSEAVAIIAPITSKVDITTNNSDKSFIVPSNEIWKINYARAVFTTDATVGNRLIALEIKDDGSTKMVSCPAGSTQAASLTKIYQFLQGISRTSDLVEINSDIQVSLPMDCYLEPGWRLGFVDLNAIAPTTDDLTVTFSYQRFTV